MKPTISEIFAAIRDYADAYAAIQRIQETSPMIPSGDQKTGNIGEFYAYLFLSQQFPSAKLEFGSHSQKAWDIRVSIAHQQTELVQVKTVSEFSKTRTISPIHHGWSQLHIVYLDKNLQPSGFWIVEDTTFVAVGEVKTGCRCQNPKKPGTGSRAIPFGANRIDELNKAIRAFRTSG